MKILIIEDEYNLADIIKDRLVKEKYTINICADGGEVTLNMKDQINIPNKKRKTKIFSF